MNGNNIFKNFLWKLFERCGVQIVSFIVSIVLARILDPSLYGQIALVTIFLSVLRVFVDCGLGSALIQKKEADFLDYSTVFMCNLILCTGVYLLLFISAPFIADFYNMPDIKSLLRVMGVILIISGLRNVQQAYVAHNMMFKKFFFSTVGGILFSGLVGIAMAYLGFGVWALVGQNVSEVIVNTAILWFTVKWRPNYKFSLQRLKNLLPFASRLLLVSLIDNIYNSARQLIIGKVYTSSELAYFNRGKQFPEMMSTNINSSVDSVMFPVLSKLQDDKLYIKDTMRKVLKINCYLMFPIMVGMACVAPSLIAIVLTEKWMDSVPVMRLFCFSFLIEPIVMANINVLKSIGKAGIYLRVCIIQRLIGVFFILLFMNKGIVGFAISTIIVNYISLIIVSWPNKKLINYGIKEQFKDLFPYFLIACFMGLAVLFFGYLEIGLLLKLFLQVVIGVISYSIISFLLRVDSFMYCFDRVKSIFIKKRNP